MLLLKRAGRIPSAHTAPCPAEGRGLVPWEWGGGGGDIRSHRVWEQRRSCDSSTPQPAPGVTRWCGHCPRWGPGGGVLRTDQTLQDMVAVASVPHGGRIPCPSLLIMFVGRPSVGKGLPNHLPQLLGEPSGVALRGLAGRLLWGQRPRPSSPPSQRS